MRRSLHRSLNRSLNQSLNRSLHRSPHHSLRRSLRRLDGAAHAGPPRLAGPVAVLRLALLATLVAAPTLVAITTGPARADDAEGLAHTTPAERADFQTDRMTEWLGLDPAQVTAVGALNLKYAEELDPLLKGRASEFTRIRQGRHILAAKDADMKQALRPDQYQKYLDTKKKLRDELEAHFADAGGADAGGAGAGGAGAGGAEADGAETGEPDAGGTDAGQKDD